MKGYCFIYVSVFLKGGIKISVRYGNGGNEKSCGMKFINRNIFEKIMEKSS